MDQFQCSECGLTSPDQDKIKTHMKAVHGIKVEEDNIGRTNFVALCSYNNMNMGEFKKHMITEHKKGAHEWWTEDVKSEYYCEECDIKFSEKQMLTNHIETHSHNFVNLDRVESNSARIVKSEYYDIKNYPDNQNDSEDEEVVRAYGKKKELEQTGIIMKGKSQAFKDANTKLKAKLIKGTMLKDNKGREIKVLSILEDDAMEVEVKTLSKKPDEKRGIVRLKMYRPNKARKKDCSIQVTRKSGFSIVFVKTIVEMFIKPIIDTIINDPDKDPTNSFTTNGHNKTMGKKIGNTEPEVRPKKANCDFCDKMFYDTKGLSIHIGRIHKEEKVRNDPPISRKKRQWEECEKSDTMCEDCGQEFTVKEALRWHIEKCQKKMKMFHDTRKLTPANKKAMSKTNLLVGSQFPTEKSKTSEDIPSNVDGRANKHSEEIKLHKCDKCEFKTKILY